jgi:hypothetical protein
MQGQRQSSGRVPFPKPVVTLSSNPSVSEKTGQVSAETGTREVRNRKSARIPAQGREGRQSGARQPWGEAAQLEELASVSVRLPRKQRSGGWCGKRKRLSHQGELPTSGPELLSHPSSAAAAEGVRPMISPSQGVDEKMIAFVRQVRQRIESLVKSTGLRWRSNCPGTAGKIDSRWSPPTGHFGRHQAENLTGWLRSNSEPAETSFVRSRCAAERFRSGRTVPQPVASQPGSFRGTRMPTVRRAAVPHRKRDRSYDWVDPPEPWVNYLV